jgi:hypothetical protein
VGGVEFLRKAANGRDGGGEEAGMVGGGGHIIFLGKYCDVALQYKGLCVINKLLIRDLIDTFCE